MIKTQLYDEHVRLGGQMVDFGGFLLPVQYQGIIEEHHAVRQAAGIFDVSHMGEFLVEGDEALAFLQYMLTNDLAKLEPGRAMYAALCNEAGACIDDILTYMLAENKYMLVPNAGNIKTDYAWLLEHIGEFPSVRLTDVSEETGLFAVQGPLAEAILAGLTDTNLQALRFYRFMEDVTVAGVSCLVSRTGYTGEDGFELYHDHKDSIRLWAALLEAQTDGVKLTPCGLGARDSLRLEAALPLHGHELSDQTSVLEAGMDRFVKFTKGDFIGRDALEAEAERGSKRRLIGLETIGRGIPRAGYLVVLDGVEIGVVTSGGLAPTLDKQIALAYVENRAYAEDQIFGVQIRKRVIEHKMVPLPFYKRPKNN